MSGRVDAYMTDGVLGAIEDWTGHRPDNTCPWRAFSDPFVVRCMRAQAAYDSGNLAWVEPEPSNRLVEGVQFFHIAVRNVQAKQMKEDAENRRRAFEAGNAKRGARGS